MNRDLARVLLANNTSDLGKQIAGGKKSKEDCQPPLGENQCAYYKEEGHWIKDFPKKKPWAEVIFDIHAE